MFGDHPDLLMYTESYWHPILFERFGMRAVSAREQLRVLWEVTFPVPKKTKMVSALQENHSETSCY